MTQDKPASVLLVIIFPSDPNLSLHWTQPDAGFDNVMHT